MKIPDAKGMVAVAGLAAIFAGINSLWGTDWALLVVGSIAYTDIVVDGILSRYRK